MRPSGGLVLAAALAGAFSAGLGAEELPLEKAWPQGADAVEQALAEVKSDAAAKPFLDFVRLSLDPNEIPGDGAGVLCFECGQHTTTVPIFDPHRGMCPADPLADPGPAWEALKRRLIAGGAELKDGHGDTVKFLSRGNPDSSDVTEDRHWGDLAFLVLRKGDLLPVSAWFVTYRAQLYAGQGGNYLEAQKLTMKADADGKLLYIETWGGRREVPYKNIHWHPSPERGENGDEVSGYSDIAWHQLLNSWTRDVPPASAALGGAAPK